MWGLQQLPLFITTAEKIEGLALSSSRPKSPAGLAGRFGTQAQL